MPHTTALLLLAAWLSGVAAAANSPPPIVNSIRVESRWAGLGKPRSVVYTIARSGDGYTRNLAAVAPQDVEDLLKAAEAAPIARNTAIERIVTQQWLTARTLEPHTNSSLPACSPEAKQIVRQRLSDPAEAKHALNEYLAGGWTDDYPLISVDIALSVGTTIHLESHQQPALMLPWKVGNTETWNADIPRALARLIPRGAEPRLLQQSLDDAYVDQVIRTTDHRAEELEERCVHRDFLRAVENRFEVVRIYHGSPSWFTAYVRRADYPPNLVITLVIRDDSKPDALAKLELSFQRSSEYVVLARPYVNRFPAKHFAIWCADGVSVEGKDHAVRISDYDTNSGIVSNPRLILQDGRIVKDQ